VTLFYIYSVVAYEPDELENSRLKFKTSGKLPIIQKESQEYTSDYERKIERCQHVTTIVRSETTLNYWMILERCPNLKEEVEGLTPGCEIFSLLDILTC
jgi:hypothetical protein